MYCVYMSTPNTAHTAFAAAPFRTYAPNGMTIYTFATAADAIACAVNIDGITYAGTLAEATAGTAVVLVDARELD